MNENFPKLIFFIINDNHSIKLCKNMKNIWLEYAAEMMTMNVTNIVKIHNDKISIQERKLDDLNLFNHHHCVTLHFRPLFIIIINYHHHCDWIFLLICWTLFEENSVTICSLYICSEFSKIAKSHLKCFELNLIYPFFCLLFIIQMNEHKQWFFIQIKQA